MSLLYFDTEWGRTHVMPLDGPRTQPSVFDSGPAPLGYEAAPPPAQPCRGWCDAQGRKVCGRDTCAQAEEAFAFVDSQAASLDITELAERQQAGPEHAANVFVAVVLAVLSVAAVVHWWVS